MKNVPVRILMTLVVAGGGISLAACKGEERRVDEVPGPAGPAETPEVTPGYDTEPGAEGQVETPEVPPAE